MSESGCLFGVFGLLRMSRERDQIVFRKNKQTLSAMKGMLVKAWKWYKNDFQRFCNHIFKVMFVWNALGNDYL